jgi:hypothetical protein
MVPLILREGLWTMASLAGFIPVLAEKLEVKASTLDERHKALVRAGLLTAKPGRGPGSGVKATPESVAMLLISMMGPNGLAQTHLECKAIARLSNAFPHRCPLTHKKTLAAALAAIIANEELGKQAGVLTVVQDGTRFSASLKIRPLDDGFESASWFGSTSLPEAVLSRPAHLSLDWADLARTLKEHGK